MRSVVAMVIMAQMVAGGALADEIRPRLGAAWLFPAQANDESTAPAEPPAPRHAAPRPPVAQAPAPPQSAEETPAPQPAPEALEPPPRPPAAQAAPAPSAPLPPVFGPQGEPVLVMTVPHLAAIGVGVIGGLIVLDGVLGVPTAAAAFVGGLTGQWWHTNYQAPAPDHRVIFRSTPRAWQDTAGRDGAMPQRWLRQIHDDGREG